LLAIKAIKVKCFRIGSGKMKARKTMFSIKNMRSKLLQSQIVEV
jgi:hypothetical protein